MTNCTGGGIIMHNLLILIQVLFIYIKILIIILFITVIMIIVILGFNAIRSNSIYGNLNHVTPENYAIKIWKRII